MKKELFICLLILILVEFSGAIDIKNKIDNSIDKINSLDLIGTIESILKKLNYFFSTENIVDIPTIFEAPLRIFLRIEDNISMPLFIIIIAITVSLFFIVYKTLKIVPFTEENPRRFLLAICIVLLTSISGSINQVSMHLINEISLLFFFLEGMSYIVLLIILILIITLVLIIIIIIERIEKKKEELEEKEYREKRKWLNEMMNEMANIFDRYSKEGNE